MMFPALLLKMNGTSNDLLALLLVVQLSCVIPMFVVLLGEEYTGGHLLQFLLSLAVVVVKENKLFPCPKMLLTHGKTKLSDSDGVGVEGHIFKTGWLNNSFVEECSTMDAGRQYGR